MSPPEWRRLLLTLLEFERAPGRSPVALREPRPLFEHIHRVMLLASDRPVQDLPAAAAHAPGLRRAARFFVRTVMLRPGADPFTLLGLQPDFEAAQLREHYRLMIRLTHPDFAAAGESWPADAAMRVNLAKDLLATPEKRAEWAAALRTPAHLRWAQRPGARPRPLLAAPLVPRPSLPHEPPPRGGWPAGARLVLLGMGAAVLAGAYLLMGARDDDGARTAQPEASAPDNSAEREARPP
ncbi:hypothetical protein Q5W_23860 [Hydrogenophaga sp. PBC]|uniref:J domain-containing protein n=1 Tax=Hydrogenophaga sp. PBC TaxID=795665 RepID=UPI00085499CE|nr:J domain-containing protein [Hydrogenophaga sp. PBC]AOS81761.1 hypothetical protein Q5W_23860 [Hydrogenophaga sp. PBC]